DVGRAVIAEGMALAESDTSTLYLLDDQTMTLELVAERGGSPALVDRIRRISPDSKSPVYDVGIGRGAAIWVESSQEYDATGPSLARLQVEGPRVQAWWCVPVAAEGRVIGMIGVGFHQPRVFPADERDFVGTFARQCGQALARARRLEAERAAAALAERL